MKNMKIKTYNESIDLGDGRTITIETGKLAKASTWFSSCSNG